MEETLEAGVAGTDSSRSRLPHITLNSDGQSHPLVNVLAIFTLVIGLLSFVLGLIIRNVPSADSKAMALTAAVTGLVCLLVGLYAQMISATREERIVIVTGIIAGFVGLALGLAHGGFS
jgi:RsiW-degrading membrane proteinase PrsW (M82 family)